MIGFASIIILLALVCGFAGLFYDYVRQHRASTWSQREESRERWSATREELCSSALRSARVLVQPLVFFTQFVAFGVTKTRELQTRTRNFKLRTLNSYLIAGVSFAAL